jgi:UDP-N-acetylglucosamine--N-acetylmuramyl-(pentapeptide) pyrophosphoryl-undecaprenol N-acetylglucosamine transferase
MKILVVGGGSGGHITPAVAVVREIIEMRPRAQIEFWTDFKYYKNVTKLCTELSLSWVDGRESRKGTSVRVRRILAGKFHRYSGWKLSTYFKHFDVTLKDIIIGNILGFLGFIGGIITSFLRLVRPSNRPDIIFLKGGYVSLPVGLIAKLFKIPYVIHESDAVAGLANRLLMKRAKKVAFGMPISDDAKKANPNFVWTGIPVGAEYRAITESRARSLKKAFSFNEKKPLVVITGGSQGSENLNEATRIILPELLKIASVGLVAGRSHYEEMVDLKRYENWDHAKLESDFRMWEFNTTMNELMGAADIVVSRAGATTIAELASLKKAVILVPFEKLPGSHQVRNAERLGDLNAAVVLNDADMMKTPTKLLNEIRHLINSPKLRSSLASRLHDEARSGAARRLAELIIEEAATNGK